MYARFMASAITAMRYQCRIGIIAAGDHGCPQVRTGIYVGKEGEQWRHACGSEGKS